MVLFSQVIDSDSYVHSFSEFGYGLTCLMWLWSLWRSTFFRMLFEGSSVPESLSCIVCAIQ